MKKKILVSFIMVFFLFITPFANASSANVKKTLVPVKLTPTVNHRWSQTGVWEVEKDWSGGFIKVNPGEKYDLKIYAYAVDRPAVFIKNGAGKVLARYPKTGANGWNSYNLEITIPFKGVKLCYSTATYLIPKLIISKIEYKKIVIPPDMQDITQSAVDAQIKNDFAWKPYDKAYFTPTFDDGRKDISDIVDLFHKKNVPCCLAIRPIGLNDICNSGETVLQVALRNESYGGETFCHSEPVLTSTSTKADFERQFITDKMSLVYAGLHPYGVVEAGGDGQDTEDKNLCVRYMRPRFLYSDRYGLDTGVIQYDHTREFLSDTDSVNYAVIDAAIAAKSWIWPASHGTAAVGGELSSIDKIENYIDYIIAQGMPKAEIVTIKYLYDTFGTTKSEITNGEVKQ
jgi:hypothetical protein